MITFGLLRFPISSLVFSISFLRGLGFCAFFIPLLIAIIKGNKAYCNRYCGRGQLFSLVGGRFGLSRKKDVPKWMKSKILPLRVFDFLFCYVFPDAVEHLAGICRNQGFTYGGDSAVDFQASMALGLPRHAFSDGVAQFAFGFYSVMLTSTVLGFLTMILFKPRSWCVYCPMGTMTQLICRIKG